MNFDRQIHDSKKWQGNRFHMIATLLMPTAHKVQGNEEGNVIVQYATKK